ncbi:MAG TPA: hypothetical protein VGA81_07020, partial [Methylomirabilota bacterium]
MSISTRLIGAIWLTVLIVIGGFTYLQVVEERRTLLQVFEQRATVLGEALKDAAEPNLSRGGKAALERLLTKFGQPAQAVAFFDRAGGLLVATPEMGPVVTQAYPEVVTALNTRSTRRGLARLPGPPVYVYASPAQRDERIVGVVLVVLDASPLAATQWHILQINGVRFLVLVLALSALALLIVR